MSIIRNRCHLDLILVLLLVQMQCMKFDCFDALISFLGRLSLCTRETAKQLTFLPVQLICSIIVSLMEAHYELTLWNSIKSSSMRPLCCKYVYFCCPLCCLLIRNLVFHVLICLLVLFCFAKNNTTTEKYGTIKRK